MTLVVPPNTLNDMTIASGTAGYYITGLILSGAAPLALPNGSDYSQNGLYKISSNTNYTVWSFTVRPGMKWSDGSAITSADILATFGPRFGFDPIYDFPMTGPEVKNEYAANSSTAVYVLKNSDAHFLDRLRSDYFTHLYPASFVNSGGENKTYFTNTLSAGPFILPNYTGGAFQMTLLRNPYFSPQPPITQINVNFVESISLTATSLLSGATDLAPVEPSNAAAILKSPSLGIIDQKAFGISSLDYNITLYPMNMTAFRQALVYGINESQFIQQAFAGYGRTAYAAEGVLSPTTAKWYNPSQTQYSYNPSKALSLLNSIGITKGSDGHLHYKNGTAVSLTFWAATEKTADVVGASVIKQNLQALGLTVNTQTTSANNIITDYGSNINNIRKAIILYSDNVPIWGLPFTDILPAWDVYWLPTVPQPHWEYPPSVDAQYQGNVTSFNHTNDPTTVKQLLNNVQALNAQYLPTIVLAYPDALWGYSNQYWTNWPTGYIDFGAEGTNWTAFEKLTPAVSSQAPSINLTTIGAIAAAIVIVVVATAFVVMRRRGSKVADTKTRTS
jgi:peptide/nickel transport system substrate-binding protein